MSLHLLGASAVAPVANPATRAASLPPSWSSFFASVTGGLVGWVAWRKHRVLGLLNGSALAANVHAVAAGELDWKAAGRRVGCHVAATASSLAMPSYPAGGYVAGAVAANVLIGGRLIEESARHSSGIVDAHQVETVRAVADAQPQIKTLALPASASP